MNAVYFDGRSARRVAVMISVSGEALMICAEGGEEITRWPLASITAVDEGASDSLRLKSAVAPEVAL